MILLHAGIVAFSQAGLPVYNGKPHKIPIRASHSRLPAEALRCGHNDRPVPCNNDGVLLLRRKAAVRHTQRPPVLPSLLFWPTPFIIASPHAAAPLPQSASYSASGGMYTPR